MTPQLQEALKRALLLAAGTFLIAAGSAYVKTHDLQGSLLIGAVAALVAAGGGRTLEGIYDGNRAAKGNVLRSDVQRRPPA